MPTRRYFLQTALAAAAVSTAPAVAASYRGRALPLGLQLYSVRDFLRQDFAGTLQQVVALGFREVEAAGFFGRSAVQVRAAMQQAGLRCVSAHFVATELYARLDEILAFCDTLQLQFIVCSFPAVLNPQRLPDQSYDTVSRSFLPEDWHFNAEQFNRIGARIQKAGLRFSYHNHTVEFRPTGGVVPFDILLSETDPALVSFELDCGWVAVGGADPCDLLRRHGQRISMLHLKDFRRFTPSGADREAIPAELGRGVIDNEAILRAARFAALRHVFVEQEGFDVPWRQSLQIDARWLARHR